MSHVLTGDVMPDIDHAQEGLQQSLQTLESQKIWVKGRKDKPVACRGARAGLGCSYVSQKDQSGQGRPVSSHCKCL